MAQKTSNMAESCSPVDCQSESVKQPKVPAARNFMQKIETVLRILRLHSYTLKSGSVVTHF